MNREGDVDGSYTFRLFLPHWATFEHPGDYTVDAKRVLRLKYHSQDRNWMAGTTNVKSEASAQISVTPPDAADLGRIIDDLGAKMLANAFHDKVREQSEVLKSIHDERVIPYFIAAEFLFDNSP